MHPQKNAAFFSICRPWSAEYSSTVVVHRNRRRCKTDGLAPERGIVHGFFLLPAVQVPALLQLLLCVSDIFTRIAQKVHIAKNSFMLFAAPDHGIHFLLSLPLRTQSSQALRQQAAASFEGHSSQAWAHKVMEVSSSSCLSSFSRSACSSR